MGSNRPANTTDMGSESLFDDPKFSDLKIRFSGQEVHAHKAVICTQSPHFHAVLTKDSDRFDLGDDDNADHVRAMLRHAYGLSYDQDLIFHIGVFAVADKYDMVSLKPRVMEKFLHSMDAIWQKKEFAVAIKAVYANHGKGGDDSLEHLAQEFCTSRMELLVLDEHFSAMLKEVAPFSAVMLTRVWEELGKIPSQSVCRQCGVTTTGPHYCVEGLWRATVDEACYRYKRIQHTVRGLRAWYG